MVNPGAFRGARKEFLMNEKANYSAAVVGGYAADAVAQIQRRYFKRFPIDLPHDEDPSPEILNTIDDDAADPEPEINEPDPQRLTIEEFAAAMQDIEDRKKLLNYRKGQIKHWLAYQHMKDSDLDPKDSGAYNPYHALMTRLTGKEVVRPRCKTGVNMWRKTHREHIEAELKRRLGDLKGKRDRLAAERDKIAREMFGRLDLEEQRSWKTMAVAEHDELMKEYRREVAKSHTPSRSPEDRQRCIQGLVRFIQPILDIVTDCTGWTATLMVGGPEPAEAGQLNIISIHAGTTSGDIKMNFGRAERERYKRYFVPIFGNFLQMCYSPEECRLRALTSLDGHLPLSTLELENEGVNLNSYDPSVPQPPVNGVPIPFGATESLSPDDSLTTTPPEVDTNCASEATARGYSARLSESSDPIPTHTQSSQHIISRMSSAPSPRAQQPALPASALSPPSPRAPEPIISPPSPRAPEPIPSPRTSPAPSPASSPILSPAPSPAPSPRIPTTAILDTTTDETRAPSPALSLNMLPATSAHREPDLVLQATVRSPTPAPDVSLFHEPSPSPERAPLLPAPPVTSIRSRNSPPESLSCTSTGSSANKDDPSTTTPNIDNAPGSSLPKGKKRDFNPSTDVSEATTNEDDRRKRRKTSTNADASSSITQASSAPNWFTSAYSMLRSIDLGPEWQELVRKWAVFEAQEGYKAVARLGHTHRPASVKDWIQRGRSPTWKPTIANVSEFGVEVTKWWTSLQPPWRISSKGKIIFSQVDGDWEPLRRPGVNGLLSIVGCLFHWGSALQKNGKVVRNSQWIAIVKDCSTMYDNLLL
ncbi:hypothetical protein BDN70DRAFT_938959 [Pholiota conissans]|uniref:Uncharacterized protein n=1 Tax=Pholiota conissans TaxID=109636 RepID=A0A9P5YMP0_9AGAR|nr:hypothetical protein BDN70DRAFT_938959 [Pholiota conissans]